ncbi:MAG: BatD family protein [Phycisphaeraceae bacterium]|nr:BatD family protein [Phycisphaeraceae bacterium]
MHSRNHILSPLLACAMALTALCGPVSIAWPQGRQGAEARSSNANVEIVYPLPRAETGEPMTVTFEVTNASTVEDPRVPNTPGLEARVTRSREFSQTTIINGQVTQRRSVRFDVNFFAEQPGRFEIPRIRIVVDGQTYESRPTTVEVTGLDTSRLARAEISIDPGEAVVGQMLTATLQVRIRNPRAGRVAADAARLWDTLILPNESRWGLFQGAVEELYRERRFRIPPRSERDADGDEWVVYELSTPFSADKPGPLLIHGIEIKLRYPRGAGERLLTIEPAQPRVNIEPPPSQGRPADFAGAVGVFELDVRARPTRVGVGDPITLSIIIADRTPGGADLTRLLPPPIAELPELTRNFRMPSEPLVGTINGRTKVFTQTLRPLSERITDIPPILFSFYDPDTGLYRTLRSQPIPITVLPVERIDTAAVTGSAPVATRPSTSPTARLTEIEGGLTASVPVSRAMLSSTRPDVGWGIAALLMAPPLLVAAIAFARRRAELRNADPRGERARTAGRRARRALASATDAAGVASIIKAFIADRSGLAAASLTRREALSILREHHADPAMCDEIDELIAAGERLAFAPNASAESTERLRDRARTLLAALERVELKVAPLPSALPSTGGAL